MLQLKECETDSYAWRALYTRHQHEKSVSQLLSGKGLETFLPLYDTARRWKDRVKHLSLPLFPNYVFVFGGLKDRAKILSTPGIYDFVRVAGVAASIPSEQIEVIQRVVEGGLSAEPHPFLKAGDRVRVKSGPLEGVEGILVRKKNLYRLVLSVVLVVRSISVEVEAADVERLSSQTTAERFPPEVANANLHV